MAVLVVSLSLFEAHLLAGDRPNVLLVCVDDLKPALGCYGDAIAKTPHTDRLASRSVVFERAYCNQAVCAPSRNSLITGSRPTSLGVYDLGTNFRRAVPDAVTLPQMFKQHGWRTEGIGKILHIGHGNSEDPASWSVPHVSSPGKGSGNYVLPENAPPKPSRAKNSSKETRPRRSGTAEKGAAWEIADVADDAYVDGRIADEAVRRLRAASARPKEPFFLAVGFKKPHLPFCAPKKYWELYDRDSFVLPIRRIPPDGAPEYAPQVGGELRGYAGIPAEGELPEDLQRTLIHGYYAATSYMDAQLGRVLDELDRLNLTDNTIIVLWGDHGWHLGDHGMWCKHTNYEEAARIPLMISAPDVTTSGARCTSLVETVDLYPTLVQLAGLPKPEVPQPLDGMDLSPLLRSPDISVKDYILHAYPRRGRLGLAVRTSRYRLVEWRSTSDPATEPELELYDYKADPLETKNVASENPEVVARLRKILAAQPEPRLQVRAASKTADNKLSGKSKVDVSITAR